MIIWTGLGFLIPIIFLLGFFGGGFLETLILGDAQNSGVRGICMFLGLALSTIACWFLHKSLVKKGTKTLMDKETGEDVVFKPSHTLFFMPMHWWGVIGAAASSLVLFESVKIIFGA